MKINLSFMSMHTVDIYISIWWMKHKQELYLCTHRQNLLLNTCNNGFSFISCCKIGWLANCATVYCAYTSDWYNYMYKLASHRLVSLSYFSCQCNLKIILREIGE